MTEERKDVQGLCTTCNHLPVCIHRLKNGFVVWHCEMFDDYVPPRVRPSNVKPIGEQPPELRGGEKLMGLCVNCEHRHHCIHAKRLGGVWHCEEYL